MSAASKLSGSVLETQSTLTNLALLLETIRDEAALTKEDMEFANLFGDPIADIAESFQATLDASLNVCLLNTALNLTATVDVTLEEQIECLTTHNESHQARTLVSELAQQRQALSCMDVGDKYHKYGVDASYANFWTTISSVVTPGQTTEAKPAALADYYGDVLVSHTKASILCPLTKEILVDPCTAGCGHCFSKEALKSFLTGTDHEVCPVPNCRHSLNFYCIKPCPEMVTRIEKVLAFEKQQAEEKKGEELLAMLSGSIETEMDELGLPSLNEAPGPDSFGA